MREKRRPARGNAPKKKEREPIAATGSQWRECVNAGCLERFTPRTYCRTCGSATVPLQGD